MLTARGVRSPTWEVHTSSCLGVHLVRQLAAFPGSCHLLSESLNTKPSSQQLTALGAGPAALQQVHKALKVQFAQHRSKCVHGLLLVRSAIASCKVSNPHLNTYKRCEPAASHKHSDVVHHAPHAPTCIRQRYQTQYDPWYCQCFEPSIHRPVVMACRPQRCCLLLWLVSRCQLCHTPPASSLRWSLLT